MLAQVHCKDNLGDMAKPLCMLPPFKRIVSFVGARSALPMSADLGPATSLMYRIEQVPLKGTVQRTRFFELFMPNKTP